jgi:hypothetical protein
MSGRSGHQGGAGAASQPGSQCGGGDSRFRLGESRVGEPYQTGGVESVQPVEFRQMAG